MILKTLSSRRTSGLITQSIKYFIMFFLAFTFIMPVFWLIRSAFMAAHQIQAFPTIWLPDPITIASFERAFSLLPIARFFLNSIIITAIVVFSNVIFCSLAAYTLARKAFRGANLIFNLVLASMMIPVHIRITSMYMMSLRLNLQDTYLGVALPITVTGFGIFLMRQFFITLPKEVEDAAVIDGCNDWGVLFRIVIPMSRAAITSLAIFAFVWSFEDFLWPLIITSSINMRPIQIGIVMFQGLEIEWGPVMAAATLTIIPMLIFYICLQKYFVQGMTSGAVKG